MTNKPYRSRTIEENELSASLDDCVVDAAAGATIVITRDGLPIATLAPASQPIPFVREDFVAYKATAAQPATALLRLIGTSAARSVLGVFVMEPARSIHQREIARRAGVGLRSAQLALGRLESLGLIKSERDGNRRNYCANRSAQFEELRALLAPEFGFASVLIRVLAPFSSRISQALIFGSAASGEDKVGSDIDLLVVGNVTSDELVGPIADAQRELGREIDLVTYTLDDFVARIAAGNHFLKTTLAAPYIDLIGGSGDS